MKRVRGDRRAGWRAGSVRGGVRGRNRASAPTRFALRERAHTRLRARVPAPARVHPRMPACTRTPRTWRTTRPADRTPRRTVLAPAHLSPFTFCLKKQKAAA